MAYWRLFYHVVWATKERSPLIAASAEKTLQDYVAEKATAMGCLVHGVAVMPEHLHLAISVPPAAAVSDIIGKPKGGSAHYMNHVVAQVQQPLTWQNGYGVVSFGEKQLPWVMTYLRQQKEHHGARTAIPLLEQCEGDD